MPVSKHDNLRSISEEKHGDFILFGPSREVKTMRPVSIYYVIKFDFSDRLWTATFIV
jgi:regulator of PEP synthase PpsR (kinase-PPPase family)